MILVAVVVGVFWRVPGADFVQWDDDINIYANPYHGGLSWRRIVWMFTDLQYVMYYAPLSWLTLSVIYQFSGLNPVGYHLTSLFLHCLNTLLIYGLIRRLLVLRFPEAHTSGALLVASALGTLLWAVHPLRVEAVAWATGLSHLLAAFFALLSLLFYLNVQSSNLPRTRQMFLGLSLVTFVAGILSYPVVMAFPSLLVIIDLLVLRRFAAIPEGPFSRAARQIWFEKTPFFLISAAVMAFTLYRRTHVTSFWVQAAPLEYFGVAERIMQAFYVWAYYLWRPFFPFSLAPAYSNLATVNPAEPRFLISFAAITLTTLFLVLKWRRFPGLLALWLSYLCLLVPMLGLTEHPHYTSDRYNYLVSVVMSLLIAVTLIRAWSNGMARYVSLAICGMLVIACGTLSFRQTLIWQNSLALFRHLLKTFDQEDSRTDIRRRIANFYRNQGNLVAAETELSNALKIVPASGPLHREMGMVLFLQNRSKEALKEFDLAISADPRHTDAYIGKASALLRQDNLTDAVVALQGALRTNPNLPGPLNELAWIRATSPDPFLRKGDEAVVAATRACQLTDFNNPQYVLTLAAAYAETGEFDSAIRTARNAGELAVIRGDTRQAELSRELEATFRKGQPYRTLPQSPK